ncbi:MAG: response regulator [Gammaproteobacteria bacterium]|nr:response regulator [Gammaproteobacteria bacterium]
MINPQPKVILCIEDNAGDEELIRLACKELPVANEMILARNGELALDILHKRNGFEDSADPDLILLDLNLPKLEGREVLADIKNNEKLKSIPVVVLSSSEADEDIKEVYSLHANCFVSKPDSALEFIDTVSSVTKFWTTVVTRAD